MRKIRFYSSARGMYEVMSDATTWGQAEKIITEHWKGFMNFEAGVNKGEVFIYKYGENPEALIPKGNVTFFVRRPSIKFTLLSEEQKQKLILNNQI